MYTRDNPSPEYLEMVRMYETMHEEGEQSAGKSGKDTFPGKMLINHAADIKAMIEHTGARSILDYGAGKGLAYQQADVSITPQLKIDSIQSYWGVDDIRCYDPGYEPFSTLPDQQYDGVISTDVLEHITEPDVPWIIEEMFSYARKFVFANVACFPAVKNLPNGQNAHCTLHPPEWWAGLVHGIAMRHTDISYRLVMSTKTGARKKMGLSKKRRTVYHTVERLL
ncbi:MAG: hypothetical protein ABR612_02350 [Chromatocurvus sp.]